MSSTGGPLFSCFYCGGQYPSGAIHYCGTALITPDQSMTRERRLELLLREAHLEMDDYNARHNPERAVARCTWCLGEGYDGDGLIHVESCILKRVRRELNGT